jgi:DNA-binding winged helix-turn-helix (wHTH) protein/tetratricopeptide (TPR) repeat protein
VNVNEAVAELRAVSLAHAAPFRLGALHVAPATRQIARDGRTETLEPRVMQVLVALYEAGGGVVARDDLIARCWDGRVVGDNAIQRTISRLREIAFGLGAGCFRLETVNKVGYRLVELKPVPAGPDAAEKAPRRLPRPFWPAVAALWVAAAALFMALLPRSPQPAAIRIGLVGVGGSRSAEFARALTIDLSQRLGQHGNPLVIANGAPGGHGAFLLNVTRQAARGDAQADVALLRSDSPDIVWSASFATRGGDAAALRLQATAGMAATIACALQNHGDPSLLSSEKLKSLFAACAALGAQLDAAALTAWRRVVHDQPANASVLATLAYVEAYLQTLSPFGDDHAPLRVSAQKNIARARAIDGAVPLSYAAEALLTPNHQFARRFAIIDRGIALDPDCAVLHGLKSDALRNIGRLDDAIDAARRAVEIDPNSAIERSTLISALAYGGFLKAAKTEIQTALRIWPNSPTVQDARFRFEFRFGDPVALLREVDRGNTIPNSPWNIQNGPERASLLARANPTRENIDALVALSRKQDWSSLVALQSLVAVGRIDDAYALATHKDMKPELRAYPDSLFRANMRPFQLDRRFMPLVDGIGLVRFWIASGTWPDFCDDKDLPYDCRTEARRLHPGAT